VKLPAIAATLLASLFLNNALLADESQALSELKELREQLDSNAAKVNHKTGPALTRDDAGPPQPQRVMLRTRDGYYLRAQLGGGHDIFADVKTPKTSEVFVLETLSPDTVRLRTREGYYVGARRGGGANVDATVKDPRTSEVFTVEWQDNARTKLRLRSREGFYIHPVSGGGSTVDARIRKPKSSEVFTLVAASWHRALTPPITR